MSANMNSPQMSAYACQQLANAQAAQQGAPSAASLGLINRQQAQAAQALGIEPQHAHLTNFDCYANGCRTCGITPPKEAMSAVDRSLAPRPGLAIKQMVDAMDKTIRDAMESQAIPRFLIPCVGVPSIIEYKPGPPRIDPLDRASAMTMGDARGKLARVTTPDAVAGCRLGCACKVHRPVKPAPYVPKIDDWDLLPDA